MWISSSANFTETCPGREPQSLIKSPCCFSSVPPEPPTGSSASAPSDTTDPQSVHTSWAWEYRSSSMMLEEPQPGQLKPARDILHVRPPTGPTAPNPGPTPLRAATRRHRSPLSACRSSFFWLLMVVRVWKKEEFSDKNRYRKSVERRCRCDGGE